MSSGAISCSVHVPYYTQPQLQREKREKERERERKKEGHDTHAWPPASTPTYHAHVHAHIRMRTRCTVHAPAVVAAHMYIVHRNSEYFTRYQLHIHPRSSCRGTSDPDRYPPETHHMHRHQYPHAYQLCGSQEPVADPPHPPTDPLDPGADRPDPPTDRSLTYTLDSAADPSDPAVDAAGFTDSDPRFDPFVLLLFPFFTGNS